MPFLTADERERMKAAAQEWSGARVIAHDILAEASGTRRQQLLRYTARIEAAIEHLDAVHKLVLDEVEERLTEARTARNRLLLSIFSLFLLAMLIAVGAGLLLARSILRPLTTLEFGTRRFICRIALCSTIKTNSVVSRAPSTIWLHDWKIKTSPFRNCRCGTA